MLVDLLKAGGVIALAFGVFYLLIRQILKLPYFSKLSAKQTERLLHKILVLVFLALLVGAVAWVIVGGSDRNAHAGAIKRSHELPSRPTIQIERLTGFLLNQPLPPKERRPHVAQYVLTIKNEDAVPLEDAVFLLKFPEKMFLDAIPEVPAGVTATWRGHYDGDMVVSGDTTADVRIVPGEIDDFIELQISRIGPGVCVKVPFRTFPKTPAERLVEDAIAGKIDPQTGTPSVASNSILSHFGKLTFRYKDGDSMPQATAVVGIVYDPETRNVAVRLPNELPANTRIAAPTRWQ